MSDGEELIFDLSREEVFFKTRGQGGKLTDYVLREPDGDTVVKWRNMLMRKAKLEKGQLAGADGMADSEPYLVSMCVFELVPQEGRHAPAERKVPEAIVRAWPNRIQSDLFKRIQKMARLMEEEADVVAPPTAGTPEGNSLEEAKT